MTKKTPRTRAARTNGAATAVAVTRPKPAAKAQTATKPKAEAKPYKTEGL